MARSKRRRISKPPIDRWALALVVALFLAGPARAGEPPPAPLDLQLEVNLNGQPTRLIGAFILDMKNQLSATRAELNAVGVAVPGEGPPDAVILLNDIAGLTYRYDEVTQSVEINLPDQLRVTRNYNGTARQDDGVKPETSTGVLLNYSAFGEASHDIQNADTAINGGSFSLEGRAFSNYGSINQSGILGTTTFSDLTALRLDTYWSYSDEVNLRSYRAGDATSGGLAWTRPIRMAGVQVQRNFDLQPDFVTMPLPSFTGSAAVPSTIDVYVNNVKTYSQQLEAGPYSITNLPVITGSGTARVVVTDSSGRESQFESDFFTSSDLLRTGLYDYSIDLGVARLNYGTDSFNYGNKPVALASLRYGITDWLTGEFHTESDLRMANAGIGVVFGTGMLGEITTAISISAGGNDFGGLVFAGWNNDFGPLSVSASTRRSIGNYTDLAAATSDSNDIGTDTWFSENPRAVDQVSLSYGFPDYRASFGMGLVHVEDDNGHTFIASGSMTKSFSNDLAFYASGFADVYGEGEYGAFAGLSYNFGHSLSAASSVSVSKDTVSAAATLAKSMPAGPGNFGWRISKGAGENAITSAGASYQGTAALVQAGAFQQDNSASFNLALDGSLVAADGGVFLGNRIDESFAIVDAGAERVPVQLENRPAGKTGANGRLLVTGLLPYQKNKISIDISNLPVTADIPKTEAYVVPRDNSGVTLNFAISYTTAAAIVVVTDSNGEYLPVGSSITVNGGSEPFLVGFDGQTYVTGLAAENNFESTASMVVCSGHFNFAPKGDEQQVIGPVKCG